MKNRIGALTLIGLAALYLVTSLATGRSATAEPPPDLSLQAADAGIDVLRAAAATLDGACFVDVRPAEEYQVYHIERSFHFPGASPDMLRSAARNGAVIVVASRDHTAQKLVGAARAADPRGKYFYLKSGVREWYLTFELPVPLFTEQPPPRGYAEARAALDQYVATRDDRLRQSARMAVFDLARMNYQPSLLGAAASKTKSAAGPRKKISGGCGG